jgi:hypothetical protein
VIYCAFCSNVVVGNTEKSIIETNLNFHFLLSAALILGIGDPLFELRGVNPPDWTYNCTAGVF